MSLAHNVPPNRPLLLIVDDRPDNLRLLGSLLSPQYRVCIANSGERALALTSGDTRPDLILLDIMMPTMDGYAVMARLRASETTRDIPVIFLTAMDAMEDEEKGLAAGAVDYITKPIRPSIVQARVRAQLDLKRMRDWLGNQNTLLEAEVARRMEENQHIQDASILALAHLAETRDPETGNHLRRTQEYVRTLAVHLQRHPRLGQGLTDHAVETLYKSAVLHDIGKVGIPDSILLKPGALTAEERAIMQTHARAGADAIEAAEREIKRPIDFLSVAKEIAHWHHERWDGTGYPDHLAGEAIPLSARLMALADVYDALVSRRVYKAAMSNKEVHATILAGRSKHFDPELVDAYEATSTEFKAIAEKFSDDGS
ncbi:MAG: two-component system response regulator [Burkholderiaceae bacterium]|nr:two-component system response regulator [Burkholderiaceae bacterium]